MTLNEATLETRFNQVTNSQESIQTLSYLCLHYKTHHRKIAQLWLKCLQKAKPSHRLTLIYLANDIVQNAKRKNATSFIADFKSILKDTIPYLRDSKIKSSVERVFNIWQDRTIFDTETLTELKSSLNATSSKNNKDNSQTIKRSTTPPLDLLLSNQKAPKTSDNQEQHVNNSQTKIYTKPTLTECINRLASIEKNIEILKQDGKLERLSDTEITNSNGDNDKTIGDLKNYISHLKDEIEERSKLSKLIEETMNKQKRLLKQSEDELTKYKSELDHVVKLKDELRLAR